MLGAESGVVFGGLAFGGHAVGDDHGAGVGLAALGERDEAGEIGGGEGAVGAPVGFIEIRQRLGRASGDDLELEGGVRGDFAEFANDGGEVDGAVAGGDPLEGGAAGVFEEGGVAQVSGGDVGSEDFDGEEGILEDPHGIAGIEADGDEVASGFFDEEAGFAGGEVAVILDGDFDVEVLGEGADFAEALQGVLEVGGEGEFAGAVLVVADVAAHGAGADRVGDAESFGEIGDGIAFARIPAAGGATDAADAGVKRDAFVGGGLFDAGEVSGVERFVFGEVRDLEGVGSEGGGVIDELESLPPEGTEGVRVYPEQGNSRLRHRNQDIGE